MKKIILLTAIIMVMCTSGVTHAALTSYTFDFDALQTYASGYAINDYMTPIYGSPVEVRNSYVSNDNGFNPTQYLTTRPEAVYIDIRFVEEPIFKVTFDGHVFDASPGSLFNYKAFDADGQVVDAKEWYSFEGTSFSYVSAEYNTSIYSLRFSNENIHAIGIDNLEVSSQGAAASAPVPSGMALGCIGMAVVNWLRRRRAI